MTLYINKMPTGAEMGDSYIGGKPHMVRGRELPRCRLCNSKLTFFLQVAFPDEHPWGGFTVSVFACTDCADEQYLIPPMVSGQVAGADVTAAFLRDYSLNFSCVVHPTAGGVLAAEYAERVAPRALSLGRRTADTIGQLGGTPRWVLEDEAPATLGGEKAQFLLQLEGGLSFETCPDAPRQADVLMDGSVGARADSNYSLFLGNDIYVFGKSTPSEPVYVLTQVD